MQMETKWDAEIRKAVMAILAAYITTQNISLAVTSIEAIIMDRVVKLSQAQADDLNKQYKELVDKFNAKVGEEYIPVENLEKAINESANEMQNNLIDLGVKIAFLSCMDTHVAGGTVITGKLAPAVGEWYGKFADMYAEYDSNYADAVYKMNEEYDRRLAESMKFCRKGLRKNVS